MATILVVDDEQDACRLLQRILSACGHTVYTFTEANGALEWLESNTPDLALLDIKLRGAGGISVLEFIRSHDLHTKAMMITGYPTAETASRALELGVDDYLVKPIDINELEALVNKALGLVL
jgi:DNA-binding NtrC family response regulator